MIKYNGKKFIAFFIILFLFLPSIAISKPFFSFQEKSTSDAELSSDLTEPITLTIPVEEIIARRMSIREFTGEGVTNEELSTILWHAFGFTNSEKRTIHSITNEYPLTLYILATSGIWEYKPQSHTLSKFRSSDMTWIGQYDTATVKIALVWNKNKCVSENFAGAEIGQVCQNIYFSSNALGLGTVTTASEVNQLKCIGLPFGQEPKIIMPIGHPKTAYQFTYNPISSNLPSIKNSSLSLTEAIMNRNETIAWKDAPLSLQQQTQLIWSSYGYSYYLDEINNKRHKTVPSSHGTYPLIMYVVNKTGIYTYQSESHEMNEIKNGKYREKIANVSSDFISNASLMIIPVLNISKVNENYLWAWYYEAAASAHNILLESTALNLSANIIHNTNPKGICSLFQLNPDKWLPMFIVPIGKQKSIENQQPTVQIQKPQNGLYFFGNKIKNLDTTYLVGSFQGKVISDDDYCYKASQVYVNDKALKYNMEKVTTFSLPFQLVFKENRLTVKAYDYQGKSVSQTIKYYKLF